MVTIINKGLSKKTLRERLNKIKIQKGIDAYKHCGVITLKKDALTIQFELRNEWV